MRYGPEGSVSCRGDIVKPFVLSSGSSPRTDRFYEAVSSAAADVAGRVGCPCRKATICACPQPTKGGNSPLPRGRRRSRP